MHASQSLRRCGHRTLGHRTILQQPIHRLPSRCSLHVANMFTGIVQGTATVSQVDQKEGLNTVHIQLPPGKAAGAQIGASVAINGTCLTGWCQCSEPLAGPQGLLYGA